MTRSRQQGRRCGLYRWRPNDWAVFRTFYHSLCLPLILPPLRAVLGLDWREFAVEFGLRLWAQGGKGLAVVDASIVDVLEGCCEWGHLAAYEDDTEFMLLDQL